MKKAFVFQNQKKALLVVAIVFMTSTMSAFGSLNIIQKEPPTPPGIDVSFAHLDPKPDSISIAMLGEDVAMIVFGSKRATLSYLNPMEPPVDGETTIGGVKVVEKLGSLNKCDLNVLKFMMADSLFYNCGPVSVTSPYAPNYALTLTRGSERVDLVYSLQSCEIGIVYNGKLIKVIRYNNPRAVTRFFRLISQNEFYDKVIEQQ